MRSSRPETALLDDEWIVSQRGPKNEVDPFRPYASLAERERTREGLVEQVATVFITNRECPYRCLMCDLWRNTTDGTVPVGAVPRQIESALNQFPGARHVKLYNSGSFFDRRAIPRPDWPAIADLVSAMSSVVVESHPRLVKPAARELADMLAPRLEVAMGLETVDPEVLPRLNKRMTLADYEAAVGYLLDSGVAVRAFVLLQTPFQSERDGVSWAIRSIEYAFSIGVECCTIIPTRAGNGAMERLMVDGRFQPPTLANLEEVLDRGIVLGRGRVFADLWDIDRLLDCPECGPARAARLREMNLSQEVLPGVECRCREASERVVEGRKGTGERG